METIDKLTGIGVLLVCITWCGIKVSESYFKVITSSQQITQPKQAGIKEELPPIDGVVPWISDLVNLSITNPEKFRITTIASLWAYGTTGIWVTNGVENVEIWGKEDLIKLTDLEKTVLYDAYINWNNKHSEDAKLNYKID